MYIYIYIAYFYSKPESLVHLHSQPAMGRVHVHLRRPGGVAARHAGPESGGPLLSGSANLHRHLEDSFPIGKPWENHRNLLI
jgi:hypothetical protein